MKQFVVDAKHERGDGAKEVQGELQVMGNLLPLLRAHEVSGIHLFKDPWGGVAGVEIWAGWQVPLGLYCEPGQNGTTAQK